MSKDGYAKFAFDVRASRLSHRNGGLTDADESTHAQELGPLDLAPVAEGD